MNKHKRTLKAIAPMIREVAAENARLVAENRRLGLIAHEAGEALGREMHHILQMDKLGIPAGALDLRFTECATCAAF